jgi:hypothetical protein
MSRAIDVAAIMSPVLDDNTVTQAFSHPRTAASRLSQNYYEWQKDRLISSSDGRTVEDHARIELLV